MLNVNILKLKSCFSILFGSIRFELFVSYIKNNVMHINMVQPCTGRRVKILEYKIRILCYIYVHAIF